MPRVAAFQGRTQPTHLGANALDPHNLDLELDLDLDVFRMYLRAKIKFQVKTFKSYSPNSTDGHTHRHATERITTPQQQQYIRDQSIISFLRISLSPCYLII